MTNSPKYIKDISLADYLKFRDDLWLKSVDKRVFFLACIPVETGATPSEVVNLHRNAFQEHTSDGGKRYYSAFVSEGAKRVIRGRNKDKKVITQARARDIVFNSDLTRKIKDYLGGREMRESPSQYFIPKLKLSGSAHKKGLDTVLSRMGVMRIIQNSPVPVPFNLHQNRNGKGGGRHMFKYYIEAKMITKHMYAQPETVRKMMGHSPRDAHEEYNPKVNIDVAFELVETTFVS